MFSRNFAVFAVVAGLALAQIGMGANAAPAAKTTEGGPMTSSGNKMWQVVSFPLRLMTGATGLAIGAIGGGVKGIVRTEEQFAQDTFGQADQNPLMVPVGLIGTLAALPVGIAKGAPQGAVQGGDFGYHLWDQF